MRKYFEAEPPMQLGYRESPLPLLALPDGEVTDERPAPVVSGMLEAWVNTKGELRKFRAVSPQVDTSAPNAAVDLSALTKATGLDIPHWPETAPVLTPLYAFDWLKAWKGKQAGLPYDVTVQASGWHGRITEVSVILPWTKAGRVADARGRSNGERTLFILEKLTSWLVFLFSAFLAARNLKAGRGDLRGARRLAAAFLIMLVINWVCRAHWMTDLGMATVLATNAAAWIASAGLVWLLYIALEPAVRARWPHALVTWSRVLIGRWQDPRVGAHVLYGALMGVTITVFLAALQWFFSAHGHAFPTSDANVGTSARTWLADVIRKATDSVEFGLVVVFAIFCFRVIFRKDWLAAVAAAVFFSLQEGEVWRGGALNILPFLPAFALLAFIVLRVGLVSTVVGIFLANILLQTPGAQSLTNPYEWAVILYPALALAIVIWAFWRTSGEELLAGTTK